MGGARGWLLETWGKTVQPHKTQGQGRPTKGTINLSLGRGHLAWSPWLS